MKESIAEEGMMESGAGQTGEIPAGAGKTKQEGKPGRVLPCRLVTALLVLGISLASSAAAIVVYDRYFATRIVAVDIKGFIAAQRDLFVQGKIDDDQLRKNIESLEKAIESIPANEVVIMGDAVVRNARIVKP
jgi:hypothetical protein